MMTEELLLYCPPGEMGFVRRIVLSELFQWLLCDPSVSKQQSTLELYHQKPKREDTRCSPSSRLAKTEGLHCPLCRRRMFFMCLSVLYNLLQPHYLIVIEQSFRWGRAQPEGIVKYAKTQFLC